MPVIPDATVVEQQIIELTNEFRKTHKRGAVTTNPILDKAAERYATYLAESGKFAHDADGRRPSERVKRAGYEYCQVAENLASALDSRGFKSSSLALQMVEGWINSPGHRKNLLAPHVSEIGVGVARVPDQHPKYVSVQIFARPQSEMYSFQVSNSTNGIIQYSFARETHTVRPSQAFTHSACEPSDIKFLKSGSGSKKVRLKSTYQAEDGQIYTLRRNKDGKVTISVTMKERLRAKSNENASSR
ncbi:MAG: CAP domain-containing protein [Hyphomicrobiaceae bacterium]